MASPETTPKLAGVVVLYNPDNNVVENIQSYLTHLDLLVVVDNSPSLSRFLKDFISGSEKISYHGDGLNRGIAAALNFGAARALKSGYQWLLTMDQDSRFEPGAVQILMAFSSRHQERLGIVSALHSLVGKIEERSPDGWGNVPYTMMSGNLLSLQAYVEAGPFLEKLFIDYVDFEYCLRLQKSSYRIVVVREAKLIHSLGSIEAKRFLGLNFHPTHHSAERKYYITRNRLYVMKTYPRFVINEAWPWAKELVKFFLFEEHKFLKLRLMGKGVLDFLRNQYGPLKEPLKFPALPI